MPSSSLTIISKSTVYPHPKSSSSSSFNYLRLSVSDLPMLSCQYIQKGVLLTLPPPPPPHDDDDVPHYHHYSTATRSIDSFISLLKHSLSTTLSHFPALAGRLTTDSSGHVLIMCNDSGVEFIQAKAKHLSIHAILSPTYVPDTVRQFFAFDATLSYSGHHKPLAAVQVTELADGMFIGCTVNHAVVDGTSFWHFFNAFAEFTKGAKKISNIPDFSRHTPFDSPEILKFPLGGPKATFSGNAPLRERIFHFSREAICKLKQRANKNKGIIITEDPDAPAAEIFGKRSNDSYWTSGGGKVSSNRSSTSTSCRDEISSFQSLSAQLWRSVTRARNLSPSKTTTFRMAVNCRHRLEPRMSTYYFGNAIQSIPTVASASELLSEDLSWGAELLHKNVVAHDDATVRQGVKDWESNPRLFPLGNFDGAMITMGSSPRFPMYDNDFGWGRPLAIRSGKANKFDGKISAFPGRESGGGSVDLEVCLAPETMADLELDEEFMQYVSV